MADEGVRTPGLRKQLLDRLGAEIDDGIRSSLRAGEFGVEIDAEGLVDRGDDFFRGDGALGGVEMRSCMNQGRKLGCQYEHTG